MLGFGLSIEDLKFKMPGLVVDDWLVFEPLLLPLPRKRITIKVGDVLGVVGRVPCLVAHRPDHVLEPDESSQLACGLAMMLRLAGAVLWFSGCFSSTIQERAKKGGACPCHSR